MIVVLVALGCKALGAECTALTTVQHLHVGSPSLRRYPSSVRAVHPPVCAAVVAVVASSGGVGDGGSCSASRSAHGTVPVSTPPANSVRSAGYPAVTYGTNTVPYVIGAACRCRPVVAGGSYNARGAGHTGRPSTHAGATHV